MSDDDWWPVYRIVREAPDVLRLLRDEVLLDEDRERDGDALEDVERWGSGVVWAEDSTIIARWEPEPPGGRWSVLVGVACRHVRWQFQDVTAWDELEPDGTVNRHVEARGDGGYVAAAALSEVVAARDEGGIEAVAAYERAFGVVPEASVPPEAESDLTPVSGREFVERWVAARRVLEGGSDAARQ